MNSVGGGMAVWTKASAEVVNCTFYGNVATAGGGSSQGGALILWDSASLVASLSTFEANRAQLAMQESVGGAITFANGCWGNFSDCTFHNNTASFLGRTVSLLPPDYTLDAQLEADFAAQCSVPDASGGAFHLHDGGQVPGAKVNAERCIFSENAALGKSALGGAVHVGSGCFADLVDTSFIRNIAVGKDAQGGGVWSGGSTDFVATHMEGNVVVGYFALGGALFVQSGISTMTGSRAQYNRATLSRVGVFSSGGALSIAPAGEALVYACNVHSNTVGGDAFPYQFLASPSFAIHLLLHTLAAAAHHVCMGQRSSYLHARGQVSGCCKKQALGFRTKIRRSRLGVVAFWNSSTAG